MLKECEFPEPADDVLILMCGPKEMNESVKSILEKGGYKQGEHYF